MIVLPYTVLTNFVFTVMFTINIVYLGLFYYLAIMYAIKELSETLVRELCTLNDGAQCAH